MYSEWASLSSVIAEKSNGSANTVLNKFSNVAGRDVSQAVAKQLATNLGITQSPEPSILITDDEVSFVLCCCCCCFFIVRSNLYVTGVNCQLYLSPFLTL